MTEKRNRLILVVDNDMGRCPSPAKALQKKDFPPMVKSDGALAINRALTSPPDIVVSAVEMPLLDGFKLCQLMRTNPVTKNVPFVFLTSKRTSPRHLGRFIRPFDEFLLKPFKEEELLGRITGLLVRMEKVTEVATRGQQALLGTLSEITLMDLLQVLRMNRRSGLLDLQQDGRLATVYISEGEVVNATLGKFEGEKAFFRLLDWHRGKFELRPMAVETETLITRPGENLILEGLRQIDEIAEARKSLVGEGGRLELLKQFHGPAEKLRPVTREVIRLLGYFSSLDDLLDQSPFNDLAICRTLQTLIDREIVGVAAGPVSESSGEESPLLSLEEALKLSYQLGVGREERTQAWRGKILLFSPRRRILQQLLEGLSRIKEFKVEAGIVLGPAADSVPLGSVGTIQVLDGTELILYSFPGDVSYRPLWESLSTGAVGSVILAENGSSFEEAARFCDGGLGRPFLLCGTDPPDGEAGSPFDRDWEPAVDWEVFPLRDRKADTGREIFRKLFGLILKQ